MKTDKKYQRVVANGLLGCGLVGLLGCEANHDLRFSVPFVDHRNHEWSASLFENSNERYAPPQDKSGVNYALEIGGNLIPITSDPLYRSLGDVSSWRRIQTDDLATLLEQMRCGHYGWMTHLAALHEGVLYEIKGHNLHVGFDGIGGYYPIGPKPDGFNYD